MCTEQMLNSANSNYRHEKQIAGLGTGDNASASVGNRASGSVNFLPHKPHSMHSKNTSIRIVLTLQQTTLHCNNARDDRAALDSRPNCVHIIDVFLSC